MKKSLFTVEHTRQLTADTYEMILSGDTSAITAPGQFVNLDLPGHFLRRPISICNWTGDALMLLVKVVGEGTHDLVRSVPGTELDVLSGLGNGFSLNIPSEHPVLAGGGIGIAPLYGLAQRMLEQGKVPRLLWDSARKRTPSIWKSSPSWAAACWSLRRTAVLAQRALLPTASGTSRNVTMFSPAALCPC